MFGFFCLVGFISLFIHLSCFSFEICPLSRQFIKTYSFVQQGAGAAETCVFKERQKNIKEEKKGKQTQPNPAMGGGMPQKLGGGSRSGFPRSGWGAGLVAAPRDPAAALIGGAAER